jgi:hypothetical protein
MTDRPLRLLLVVSTVLAGTFFGVLLTAAIAISPSLALLDGAHYALVKQAQIRVLQVAMTADTSLYYVTAIAAMVLARRSGHGAVFKLTLAAVVLISVCLGYSAFTDIPYNQQILSWAPAAPPADWAGTRDAWDFANALRAVPTFFGFALQAWATALVPAAR